MRIGDEALVLRRLPFRDASWILSLLTRGHGVVSVLAKGARSGGRSGGAERGALHGFHTLLVEARGRGAESLATLARGEILRGRHRLPMRPEAAGAGQLLGEAVYRFVPPGDPLQVETFGLLESALDALEEGAEPLAVAGLAVGRLLGLFGYGWRVDACVGCGREGVELPYFSIRRGAAVCVTCGAPYAGRLPVLHERLRRTMAGMEGAPGPGGLTRQEWSLLYRLGMARLELTGGCPLNADAPFRRLAGVAPVTGPSHGLKRIAT